ncbi:hypothetical protein D3C87_1985730 [compost metagenome]
MGGFPGVKRRSHNFFAFALGNSASDVVGVAHRIKDHYRIAKDRGHGTVFREGDDLLEFGLGDVLQKVTEALFDRTFLAVGGKYVGHNQFYCERF